MDETTPRKGLYVAPDDLTVGQHFAVVGCKCHDNPVPIGGMAFKVTAINFPFLVGKLVGNGESLTLDTRFLNFMRVTDEYVAAQSPTPQEGMVMVPAQLLAMLRQNSR